MKYMLMMFGDGRTLVRDHTAEWVTEMIGFMRSFNEEVAHHGELVEARGLADPRKAKTVALEGDDVVVSDGPFAPVSESLAGFWVVNVDSEHRAVELASKVVRWAERVEIRELPEGQPGH
jgi:hypothetical protein